MAVKYWTGTVDGDWATAGNWSPSGVPIAADEVIFDGRSNVDVDTGAAVGDTGGVTFDLLHVKNTYTGNIGTASLRIHTDATRIIYEGTGTMYLECSELNATTDSTISEIVVSSTGILYLSSDVNTVDWTSEFTLVHIARGTVYISDDTNVRTLRIMPTRNNSSFATVDIGQACLRLKATAANMDIYMQNGILTIDSPVNIFEVYDGIVTYGDSGSAITGLDITTLRLYKGTFTWQPDDTGDDAYIGQAWLFGGTLTAAGAVNNDRDLVLGNGAGKDIFVFPGATLNINRDSAAITVAADSQLISFGGEIEIGRNINLAITENLTW